MESHEALATAINRKTVSHAKALGLSTSTLNKWQEPCVDFTDSGAYNPLDRIRTIVKTSLELGTPLHDALAPIMYLAQEFNLCVIALPPCNPCLKEITEQIYQTTKEFADLIRVSSDALEDGRISPDERLAIEKVGMRLLSSTTATMKLFQEAAK